MVKNMSKVGLATAGDFPSFSSNDQLAADVLVSHGLDGTPVVWNDPGIDWNRYDMVIIRSCWRYHRQPTEFRTWIELVEAFDVAVWN